MRPDRVHVRYLDRDGVSQEAEMTGLLAMVIQHEVDHLDGVLILDRAA
jgi:peptide deformylase